MADSQSAEHLFGHVQDATFFEVPNAFVPGGKIAIPQPLGDGPVFHHETATDGFDFILTKFMVIEVIVAVLLVIVFAWLAARMRGGGNPRGKIWNLLESMLVFIRDEVARPAIGKHDADAYLPFLWTLFFFILGCNLFGLLPWSGSPTGALATTSALAVTTFIVVVGSGMKKSGPGGFWKSLVPHMDLPLPLMILLWPMLFVLEFIGLLIKHVVLSVRLLANMMAGHLVLAVLLSFIAMTAGQVVFWGVMPASVLGATALSLLELFVAFLQAYIFTFLSALFIGTAVHPH